MNHYKSIKKIANFHGFRKQGNKLAEEASELSAAMNKLLAGEGGRAAVIEEMADVIIMLEQMQYLMHIDKREIVSTMESKLNRQLDIISGKNKNVSRLDTLN